MSTIVTYNGITITNCLTRTFDQQAVMDDSGTDLLHHKFTVGVVGYIHLVTAAQTVNISTNGSVSTAINQAAARALLMEPRGVFVMSVAGVNLLAVTPPTGNIGPPWGDVNNGPKPKDFKIEQIVGGALMKVYFEIELCVVECNSFTNSTGILSNRWNMKNVKDGNFYTTRTITGRMRFANLNVTVAAFQNFVFPTLAKGYRREQIDTTTSVDGLTIDYTIADKERFASPPSEKVTEWEGTHTISTGDGVTTHDELVLRFEAPKDGDKAEMLTDMLEVIRQKLDTDNPASFLEQAAFIDHLETNVIEARVLMLRNPSDDSQIAFVNLPSKNFGKPLNITGYDKDEWRLPSSYKTETPTGLLVAYLQSPCDSLHSMPRDDSVTEQTTDDERNTNVRTYTYTTDTPIDPTLANSYSADARAATYTFYDLSSEYIIDQNTVQLPIAASSTTSDDTSVFVQIAPPTGRRRVRVHAQRMKAAPLLPDPRQVFLNGRHGRAIRDLRIKGVTAQVTADGKNTQYENEMDFTVGFAKPPSMDEALTIGAVPWGTLSMDETAVQPGQIVTGIV